MARRKHAKKTNGRAPNGRLDAVAVRALENNLHERYISIIDEMVRDHPEIQRQLAEHTARILETLLSALRERYPAAPGKP